MRGTTMLMVAAVASLAAALAWGAPRPAAYAASAAAGARPLPVAQRLERRFLQLTAANLRFQSEASRLAAARSNNPAVKDLANTLLARQQQVQPELLRLLHVRGMAMPIPANAHTRLLKQLGKLSGAKFDRLYVDEVVLRPHQAEIANYEKVAAQAEDPVLKAWVEKQLPALRLQLAKAARALPNASLHGQRAV